MKERTQFLVDASNAFNNLNRKVALMNIALLCPAITQILTNCYRGNAQLFVNGETLLSREGVTQGDPLAMAMFALASMPLIRKVATEGATQAWFADDPGSGGKCFQSASGGTGSSSTAQSTVIILIRSKQS